jgi:hypothetical protein
MDDLTQVRSLLLAQFGVPESLYVQTVKRLRACNTIFGENIKLSMRQIPEEQWSRLPMPYLMVFPTVTRIRAVQVDQPADEIINPRSITFVAQFDAKGSEHEWQAADEIELAEKQLIQVLVNWKPTPAYKPTVYAGMRVEGTRQPHVKVAYVFTFFEQIVWQDDPLVCGDGDIVERITVRVAHPCPAECDPCTGEVLNNAVLSPKLEPEPPGAQWPAIGGWPPPGARRP